MWRKSEFVIVHDAVKICLASMLMAQIPVRRKFVESSGGSFSDHRKLLLNPLIRPL